ncbi:MAG: TraB/GumN family protein [Parvibaculaceae bacterium]
MLRLLAVLAAFSIAWLATAQAETIPACRGKSLLDAVRKDRPQELAAAEGEAAAVPNGKNLLWRIEGLNGAPPSWLFGTIHLTDDRVRTLPEPVAEALGGARALAVEIENAMDPNELSAVLAANPHLIMLPEGKQIWDLLDEVGTQRLKERLVGVSMDGGRTAKLQPWLLSTSFTVPDCESYRVMRGIKRLDDTIIEEARARNLKVHSLENIREQMEAMAAMPLDGQAAQLQALLDPEMTAEDRQETLIQLYLRRQIGLIFPLMERAQNGRPQLAEVVRHFAETLIVKRNHVMAERAQPLLRAGGVVIAVGAAHLPGPEGLVELLRKAGYKVAPLD